MLETKFNVIVLRQRNNTIHKALKMMWTVEIPGNTNLNVDMIAVVVIANMGNCKLTSEKFGDFNGIWTCGLCVSAAVLYQLSYEDPYIGSRQICERNEK